MNENNITRFEVSNFKKFDHLVIENIGQVNLITGDNNVGKTTLLEALLFNEDNTKWIKYLHQTLMMRRINLHLADVISNPKFPGDNFLRYIFKELKEKLVVKYELKSGIEHTQSLSYKSMDEINDEEKKYRKDRNNNINNAPDWVVFEKDEKIDELQWLYFDDLKYNVSPIPFIYWPFITFSTSYGDDLQEMVGALELYSRSINFNEREQIVDYLKTWVSDIKGFDFGPYGNSSLIRFATGKEGIYHAITTFGDGIQKFFRYAIEILYAQKKGEPRIMIDEIDTGVHYLKMKDEWKAIFELSKQTGIQIFATTHSMDCIKAFVEAGEENEAMKNDLRLIELEEFTAKDGTTKHTATTFNHETLKYKIEMNTNVLGGDVWR